MAPDAWRRCGRSETSLLVQKRKRPLLHIRRADIRLDILLSDPGRPVQITSPLVREAPWVSYPGCRALLRATPDVEIIVTQV